LAHIFSGYDQNSIVLFPRHSVYYTMYKLTTSKSAVNCYVGSVRTRVRTIPVSGIGIGPILKKYHSRYRVCKELAAQPLLIHAALHQLNSTQPDVTDVNQQAVS